jgi:uncharacterized protein YdeI (YjbR/CyaY-like superfamily)
MSPSPTKSFRAVLEPTGDKLRWVIVRIPFDMAKAWPERNGRRVRGEINGFAFRTSLFPSPRTGGDILLVNKAMQKGARAKPGDTAQFRLEPDMEEREVTVPAELARALKADRQLRRWFDASFSPSMRREIGKWVGEPKGEATRQKRADQMAERLLLAMEGEIEPPPILRAAFQGQPAAREGWEAMAPARKRNHLLAIFYYQTAEGRARRAAKAVEDALAVAKRVIDPGEKR